MNNKKIFVPQIIAKKKDNIYFVSGKINTQNIILDDKYIKDFIKQDTLNIDIKEIDFDSENDFDLKIQKNFKIKDLNIVSKINLDYLIIENPLELEKIFPNINKKISFKNHKIKINYKKDYLKITGSGETILQNEIDTLEYKILKNKDEIKYDTSLIISKNLFNIDFLNYEKNKETDLKLNIKAKKISNKDLIFEEVTLKEKNNTIFVKNLILTNNNKINEIEKIQVDYIDKENLENKIKLMKINDNYLINGNSFNINKIISVLLEADNSKNKKLFNKNLKFDFDLKKVYLDEKNIIRDFQGYLFLNDNKVSELSLEAKFDNQKNIKLTINSNNGDQITTLFSNEAKPLVDRYKFIKGFNEGSLDFYSIKKNNNTKSTLKIYDFKLKELPALTKILTLASLQGIADLLSGEGIRFSEFEMNFSNKDNLMTIDEIYAIGPAISILMDGYIEKKKLISLRGTLVPATTINKTIGSIPILGDILVGKKTGEGVFGVSFKVKGPPKNLETSVNPIKTLTPRFITRTLEKLKKTN